MLSSTRLNKTAKRSHPQHVYWEEKAVPGDILAETIFKFIAVTLQLTPKTPSEDQSEQINNRRQAGIRLEHVGYMVATETEIPTMEDIAQRFRNLKIHQTEVPEPDVNPEFTAWLQRTLNEKIERELQKKTF